MQIMKPALDEEKWKKIKKILFIIELKIRNKKNKNFDILKISMLFNKTK